MNEADLDLVLEWRNHIEVRRYMYTQDKIDFDQHKSWFDSSSKNTSRRLLIFEQGDTPLGFVSFNRINGGDVADWGFYTAPDAPKGTGKELGETALAYGFDKLNLHKVCGQALSFNERSIRFHRRLGFKQEGILRDQYRYGKSYCSVVCFGLLTTEWKNIKREEKNV
ncbi:UDP-4-amino-4,6-dideoxy-N-acetyl-beta-L-altrosamine N-acetyltransferase [Microbulbifer elongatus]|uniref:UDP-4-amino-4, 6-dideoxy-N-acetyl-beta-L-altrosamine N-acetyltransferase n=1 Tax=Microbulbifer elongatus TaxID=86173 RepID=UPI001E3B374C|nr:UDP-4-amino-4,6-dideoxy-N-acetyl-beta-L-altrosamine N-acetyltransferase [Microbulbifer elongatus]